MHKGVLKLTDFGISKQLSETAQSNTFTNQWNISYQAPERLLNIEYKFSSDIWSLGCIMYYLCTLRHPFHDDQEEPMKQKILDGEFPEINETYSQELKGLIRDMLQVEAESRPTADEIIERIQEALEKYDY